MSQRRLGYLTGPFLCAVYFHINASEECLGGIGKNLLTMRYSSIYQWVLEG
jgi:hypothetical protein